MKTEGEPFSNEKFHPRPRNNSFLEYYEIASREQMNFSLH
jgi:hypothetical protein